MAGVMEMPKVRESNGRVSSSPGLSSPPTPSSPTHAKPTTQSQSPFLIQPHLHSLDGPTDTKYGGEKGSETSDAKNILASVKKPRKKRDPANTANKRHSDLPKTGTPSSTATVNGDEPVVKQRKPRSDKGIPKRGRKPNVVPVTHADVASAQTRITDSLAPSQPPTLPHSPTNFLPSQNGKDEAIPKQPDSNYTPHHLTQAPTPRNSGQNYDPIRSSTVEARSVPPSNQYLKSPTPPRPVPYGSASNSPSISSLIDPPSHIHYPQLKRDSDVTAPISPPKKARLTPPEAISIQQVPEPTHRPSLPSNAPLVTNDAHIPMDIDGAADAPAKASFRGRKSNNSTGTSTPTATKTARQKEAPVAMSSGNGLLSSTLFGGPSESTGSEKTAPTVVLDVPLNGETNRYINFARLAEERYGFNALHPRLAAQRERLARVAAAGAALENAEKRANGSAMSGDDMSVDVSEGEAAGDDSNVEMGGISLIERDVLGSGKSPGDGSEGPAPAKRKKRMMKEDQYDKEDPFVDDAELAWEEQAAASKDGFFVYSGPLVPEGEKPNVERYATTDNILPSCA